MKKVLKIFSVIIAAVCSVVIIRRIIMISKFHVFHMDEESESNIGYYAINDNKKSDENINVFPNRKYIRIK